MDWYEVSTKIKWFRFDRIPSLPEHITAGNRAAQIQSQVRCAAGNRSSPGFHLLKGGTRDVWAGAWMYDHKTSDLCADLNSVGFHQFDSACQN